MTYYAIRVREDGRHQVYTTTNGRDRLDIPTAAFGKPRDAIRYCEMREARISPLRAPGPLTGTAPALWQGK